MYALAKTIMLLILLLTVPATVSAERIVLDGLRQPEISVEQSSDKNIIATVTFLPVSIFPEPMNYKVNRKKARQYLAMATCDLKIACPPYALTVEEESHSKSGSRISFQIKATLIRTEEKKEKSAHVPLDLLEEKSELLSRKSDYLENADAIIALLKQDLGSINSLDRDSLLEYIASYEESYIEHLKSLGLEAEKDMLLLSTEKSELAKAFNDKKHLVVQILRDYLNDKDMK